MQEPVFFYSVSNTNCSVIFCPSLKLKHSILICPVPFSHFTNKKWPLFHLPCLKRIRDWTFLSQFHVTHAQVLLPTSKCLLWIFNQSCIKFLFYFIITFLSLWTWPSTVVFRPHFWWLTWHDLQPCMSVSIGQSLQEPLIFPLFTLFPFHFYLH